MRYVLRRQCRLAQYVAAFHGLSIQILAPMSGYCRQSKKIFLLIHDREIFPFEPASASALARKLLQKSSQRLEVLENLV
jgi:hypothetical protein